MLFNIRKNVAAKHNRSFLVRRVVFGCVYVVLGAEIFLRVFAPVPIVPTYLCATNYGIQSNEPNQNYWLITPEYHVNMRTNSKGIRSNREIPYEKPADLKRIVLLGDSFAMGYGVSLEDTFSSQMKRFLEKAGVNCEIINLGTPCFGNAEELIVLKEEGLKYQPDLVLLVWHPSDYAENVRSNLFSLEDGHLVRKSKTYLNTGKFSKMRKFLIRLPAYRWVAEHSQLDNFIRKQVLYPFRMKVSALKTRLNNTNVTAEIQKEQKKQRDLYRKELTFALLNEIERECESNGANFLIFDIPIRLSRTEFESRFPKSEDSSKQHFEVFSPISLFKRQNGEKIYWERSEGHLSPFGCRIVGNGLAELILSKGLID